MVRTPASHVDQALLSLLGDSLVPKNAATELCKIWANLCTGINQDPVCALGEAIESAHDEAIIDCHPFESLSRENLLPFSGHVTVAYIPSGWVASRSGLVGLIHCLSRRPQTAYDLADQLAQALQDALSPEALAVIVQVGNHTSTAMWGLYRSDSKEREMLFRAMQLTKNL